MLNPWLESDSIPYDFRLSKIICMVYDNLYGLNRIDKGEIGVVKPTKNGILTQSIKNMSEPSVDR